MTKHSAPRADVYTRVTDKIIADPEQGVRPWMKPWNTGHAAGRLTKPLRHNGQPYNGINILMLWTAAVAQGYSAWGPAPPRCARSAAPKRRRKIRQPCTHRRWFAPRLAPTSASFRVPEHISAPFSPAPCCITPLPDCR
jgi:hypothetical protein